MKRKSKKDRLNKKLEELNQRLPNYRLSTVTYMYLVLSRLLVEKR